LIDLGEDFESLFMSNDHAEEHIVIVGQLKIDPRFEEWTIAWFLGPTDHFIEEII